MKINWEGKRLKASLIGTQDMYTKILHLFKTNLFIFYLVQE